MINMTKILKSGLIAVAFLLPSLGLSPQDDAALNAALASEARPAADREFDDRRKPDVVLAFAGVRPGMSVLDINSGGGYYTRILSAVVGNSGKTYAHNGAIYWDFMKRTSPDDFADLTNLTEIHTGQEAINLPEGSVDVALSALAYHDYFFTHEASTGESVADINKSVYNALKKGGIYVVIDHVGVAGASDETINAVHRIDPLRVKAELEEAGFTFVGESDALRNPDNAPDARWFGVKPRYTTDRFVYKFIKE